MDGLAHIGVGVHGIDKVNLRVFLAKVFHRCDHRNEATTEILSTVTGDENELLPVV